MKTAILSLLALLVLCCPLAPAQTQFDPKLDIPYQLDVVLLFPKNRIFTPVFRNRIESELRESLQQTYGKLAQVQVMTQHPLCKEIEQKGLAKALDGFDQITGKNTHFVQIDFVNGQYRIQTRQHDGSTGLASPQMNQHSTGDRTEVPRLAALLVDQDFGLTGTVKSVKGELVDVAIQGGALVDSLEHWLKPGDVFAVSRILKADDKQRAERLDKTLLQVTKTPVQKGIYRCKLYSSRYEPEHLQMGPGVLGYRCTRLATRKSKLSFHLVAATSDQPFSGVQIHVSPVPFDEPDAQTKSSKISVDARGKAQTPTAFADVAFVRVISGVTILAEFPHAIVDAKTVTCRVSPDLAAVKEAQLELRLHQWLKRILEDLSLASDRVKLLKEELDKSPEQALQLAKLGADSITAELKSLNKERLDLEIAAEKAKVKLSLEDGQQGLKELAGRQKELDKFINDLEIFIKEDATTKKLKTMLAQGALLEEQAQYDQAIEVYKKVLEIRSGEKEVKAHLDQLQADWNKVRGEAHQKARDFIYLTWPQKMDTATLKVNLAEAKKAFAICKQTEDRLTPRKMIPANLEHVLELKKRLDVLQRSSATEDNRNEKKAIAKLAAELQDLHQEVRAWVEVKVKK